MEKSHYGLHESGSKKMSFNHNVNGLIFLKSIVTSLENMNKHHLEDEECLNLSFCQTCIWFQHHSKSV